MAVTLLQYMTGRRFYFAEKGMQVEWNRLFQLIAAQGGSGITPGTTVLDSLDTVDGTGTGFQKDTAVSTSGPFAATGTEATVSGEKVVPMDPGGGYGPNPARLSQTSPTNGFRFS